MFTRNAILITCAFVVAVGVLLPWSTWERSNAGFYEEPAAISGISQLGGLAALFAAGGTAVLAGLSFFGTPRPMLLGLRIALVVAMLATIGIIVTSVVRMEKLEAAANSENRGLPVVVTVHRKAGLPVTIIGLCAVAVVALLPSTAMGEYHHQR